MCSRIFNFMVSSGFMVHYMLRVNINIAIVDMVSVKQDTNFSNSTSNDTVVSISIIYNTKE